MLTEIAFGHKQDDSIKINHAFREIYCKVWCIANDIALFIADARQIELAVTVICLSFDNNDDDVGGLFFANAGYTYNLSSGWCVIKEVFRFGLVGKNI